MFKNLYNRLLTRHPLLWNTRWPWVMGIALVFHLFFFLAGIGEVTAEKLQHYYSLSSVFSFGLITFSILCSTGLLIGWLVFYLRNNAFKQFYIIGRFHLVREFFLAFSVILFSILFFESFLLGAWCKARTLSSRAQLVKDANTVNLAMAFIPLQKSNFFLLNGCHGAPAEYMEGRDYFDTAQYYYRDTGAIRIREALRRKDAFSFKNYCLEMVALPGFTGFNSKEEWMQTRDRWIDNHSKDSIQRVIQECLEIARKYSVVFDIEAANVAELVFADSNHAVTRMFASNSYRAENDSLSYFDIGSLQNSLHFLKACYNGIGNDDASDVWTVEFYIALCLTILLYCYRLFSRRIFLISIIGTIVWSIVFALFTASSGTFESFYSFYFFLFAVFTITGIVFLRSNGSKTMTGVLLNWHIFMLPFVLMLLVVAIGDHYHEHIDSATAGWNFPVPDSRKRSICPVGYWTTEHAAMLIRLNAMFVLLYTAFIFSRLAKQWRIMAEE